MGRVRNRGQEAATGSERESGGGEREGGVERAGIMYFYVFVRVPCAHKEIPVFCCSRLVCVVFVGREVSIKGRYNAKPDQISLGIYAFHYFGRTSISLFVLQYSGPQKMQ